MTEQRFREIIKTETELSLNFQESSVRLQLLQSKSMINLQTEEQILKTRLESLKKENFSLEASIQAWKATYEQKQNELAEAESKLDEIYKQIWSAREEFCERADNFDNQYGILSKCWKERMDEIFDPAPKKTENQNQEKLEINISELQEEVKVLQKENLTLQISDTESRQICDFPLKRDETWTGSSVETNIQGKNSSPGEEIETTKTFSTSSNESGIEEVIALPEKPESPERQMNEQAPESTVPDVLKKKHKKKKVRFSKKNDSIVFFDESSDPLKMKFFSIVDRETVRKANRFRKLGKKSFFP